MGKIKGNLKMKLTKVGFLISLLMVSISLGTSSTFAIKQYNDSWETRSMLRTERGWHSIAKYDGKIYIFGGYNYSTGDVNTVEEYNPDRDRCKNVSTMPQNRTNFCAVTLNKKIYLIGGQGTEQYITDIDVFNPVSKVWSKCASLPVKLASSGAAVLNGKIYVAGGNYYDAAADKKTCYNTLYEFNPVKNKWRKRASMLEARSGLELVAVNGKLYALGGDNGGPNALKSVEEYDPNSNIWVSKNEMIIPSDAFAAAVLGSKIYTFGGGQPDSNLPYNYGTVQEYNCRKNKWTQLEDMPISRYSLDAITLDGEIYVVGGVDSENFSATKLVEAFNPY